MTVSLIMPPPLKKGDTIGIIAPAGQIVDQQRFEQGLGILSEMGFETKFPREMWPGRGYLADTDSNRLKEFHTVFADTDVQCVMAARGGYGSLRLLEKADFQTVCKNPKMLLGFSDISLLLNQVVRQSNIISFHGPVVTSLGDCTKEALERLYNCLTGNWQKAITPVKIEILRGGDDVVGQLIGGNLSTLMTTIGTPYDFSWKDAIVVLEDIGEPTYRLDRMFTQLGLSGKLGEAAGIILGDFTLDSGQDILEKMRYTEYVWERVLGLTANSGIPIWGNFPTGHCPENLTLPMGATTVMDSRKGALQFH